MKVAVCDYGAGNVRSVLAALSRLGADAKLSREPADVLAEQRTRDLNCNEPGFMARYRARR